MSNSSSKEQLAREAYERWHQGRSPDDLAGQLWRSGYMSAVVDGRRPPETKALHQLSTVELLNERDRILSEISRRVLGDPRQSVSIGPAVKTSGDADA